MKQVKVDAQKQIERNKIILKDLINKYPLLQTDPSQPDPSAVPTTTKTIARTICRVDVSTITTWMRAQEQRE